MRRAFFATLILIIIFCVIYPHGCRPVLLRHCLTDFLPRFRSGFFFRPRRLAGFLSRRRDGCFGLPPSLRGLGGRPRCGSSIPKKKKQVNRKDFLGELRLGVISTLNDAFFLKNLRMRKMAILED